MAQKTHRKLRAIREQLYFTSPHHLALTLTFAYRTE